MKGGMKMNIIMMYLHATMLIWVICVGTIHVLAVLSFEFRFGDLSFVIG